MIYNTLRKPIFFLPLISSLTTMAQKAAIGIRPGINMGWSKTYNMRYHGSKFEKSFMSSFSLPIEIPIKNKLSLKPEFSFIQKGIKANLHGGYINYTEIMKLSYLEIPFLAKLNIVATSKIKLEFILGPGMGLCHKWIYMVERLTNNLTDV